MLYLNHHSLKYTETCITACHIIYLSERSLCNRKKEKCVLWLLDAIFYQCQLGQVSWLWFANILRISCWFFLDLCYQVTFLYTTKGVIIFNLGYSYLYFSSEFYQILLNAFKALFGHMWTFRSVSLDTLMLLLLSNVLDFFTLKSTLT